MVGLQIDFSPSTEDTYSHLVSRQLYRTSPALLEGHYAGGGTTGTITINATAAASLFSVVLGGIDRPILSLTSFSHLYRRGLKWIHKKDSKKVGLYQLIFLN
jgi:hypothetical protein